MKIENINTLNELITLYRLNKSKSERLNSILEKAELLSTILGDNNDNFTSLIQEAILVLLRKTDKDLAEIERRIEQM